MKQHPDVVRLQNHHSDCNWSVHIGPCDRCLTALVLLPVKHIRPDKCVPFHMFRVASNVTSHLFCVASNVTSHLFRAPSNVLFPESNPIDGLAGV